MKYDEVLEKLKEEFMSDIGYRHNSRFTDPNSPYYGQDGWITTTSDSTNCVLCCTSDGWYVDFDFRNVSDDYAVEWCKNFLQRNNIKFTKVEPVYNSEKGWFSVYAYVSKKAILEKYNLYNDYLKGINSKALETYKKLIDIFDEFNSNKKDITDIENAVDVFASYFRFGDDDNHVSIRIGGKDSEYGLIIFSILYIKEDGNTTYKSDYMWSNTYNDHIRHLKSNLRSHNNLDIIDNLYNNL